MRKNIMQMLLCGVLCLLSAPPRVQGAAGDDAFKTTLTKDYGMDEQTAQQVIDLMATLVSQGTLPLLAKRQAIAKIQDDLQLQTTQNTKKLDRVRRQSVAPGITPERSRKLQDQTEALQKKDAELKQAREALAQAALAFGWSESVAQGIREHGAPIPLPRDTIPSSSPSVSQPSSASGPASSTTASPSLSTQIRDFAARISLGRGVTIPDTATLKKLGMACARMDQTSNYVFDGKSLTPASQRTQTSTSSSPATSTQPSAQKPSSSSSAQKPSRSGPSTISEGIRDLGQRIVIAPNCEITDFKTFTKNLATIVHTHPKVQYFSDGTILMTKRQIRQTMRASQALRAPATSGPTTPSTQPAVIPAPPESAPASSTSPTKPPKTPGGLLGAIQKGTALKPASERQLASPTQQQEENLVNILSGAMTGRRGAMGESDDENESDDDSDYWSDDD